MRSDRYSLPAILLHWAQAGVVLWLLWLGWTMVDLPKGAERSAAYGLHKSLGLLVVLLTLLRLVWRHRVPAPPSALAAREQRLAHLGHVALYVFLLVAPLAGYLASAFTPFPIKFFGLELPRLFEKDESLNELFKQIHVVSVWAGSGLIAGHVGAVVLHQLKGQGVLKRMLP